MTVAELIEELKKEDPAALVVMSCDAEGNRYSPLRIVAGCRYEAETTCNGEIDHPDYPEPVGWGVSAVALWPTN